MYAGMEPDLWHVISADEMLHTCSLQIREDK